MAIRTPYLATDAVIECYDDTGKFKGIVLIERKNPPLGIAFPGGFVEVGERVEEACVREMMEETGLCVEPIRLIGVYSDPKRDPRFHTVSLLYLCRATGSPQGGDDAKRAFLVDPRTVDPALLLFDHADMLRDYLNLKETC